MPFGGIDKKAVAMVPKVVGFVPAPVNDDVMPDRFTVRGPPAVINPPAVMAPDVVSDVGLYVPSKEKVPLHVNV